MKKILLVISDLHLGGREGFQICPAAGRARLARFIDWAAAQKSEKTQVQLVLNGDIVDFLAEEDETGFAAFVIDQDKVLRKLQRIAHDCDDVFTALRRFAAAGNTLTLLIGNHDVELSLPRVRRQLLDILGDRGIEYLYDNEALTVGPVLIEHGNRYDGWNMVNHGQLRRIRSRLSRGESPGTFAAQPGSELVARVLNPVKKKFGFVDLLKPETGAVLPILAVLDPGLWKETGGAVRQSAAAWYRGRSSDEGAPERADYVATVKQDERSGTNVDETLPDHIRAPIDRADTAASANNLGAPGEVSRAKAIAVQQLLKQFRAWRGKADLAFNVSFEADEYLKPARERAKAFRIVVFGHTHLVKRIEFGSGARYLNAGTWADIMRIPAEVYDGSDTAGIQALRGFLDNVERNNITAYRRQIPTFARIDFDSRDQPENADVFVFDDDGTCTPVTTDALRTRLA